jgi:transposase
MKQLSLEDRWRVIHVYNQLQSFAATAKECKCSIRTVMRWVDRRHTSTSLETKPKSGRKRHISAVAGDAALQMLTEGTQMSAKQVALQLKASNITNTVVHKSTVIRHARMAALRQNDKLLVHRGGPRKGLTAVTKHKRAAFAKSNTKTLWDRVMFTDRKKFHFRYPGSKVARTSWMLKSRKNQAGGGVYQPSHPSCINIYVGITRYGVTAVHEVAGTTKFKHTYTNKKGDKARNITTSQYKEVLCKTLLPGGCALMNMSSWILQQDNDPTHKIAVDVVKDWNRKHGTHIQVLPCWPPSSPDLNLIENLWSYVEDKVNLHACKSFEEYKQCVIKELTNKTPAMMKCLSNLYASMPRRIAETINGNGEKLKY